MKYIVALGSNVSSNHAFNITLEELKCLGKVLMSSVVSGVDYTGKTEFIYHNAVAMITLHHVVPYDDFNQRLKAIEIKCGRTNQHSKHEPNVPMDLDILAYCESCCGISDWRLMEDRLPFKAHEKKGIDEIAPFLSELVVKIGHMSLA